MCKQMGLDANFANAEKTVFAALRKRNKGKSEVTISDSKALTATKANHEKVVKLLKLQSLLSSQRE